MHPTFPGLPPEYLFSKIFPATGSYQSQGRFLVTLSCQIDEFLIGLLENLDGNQSPYRDE